MSTDVRTLEGGGFPPCPHIWDLDQSIRLMVVAATTNLIAPWEVESDRAARAALVNEAVALGLGPQQGGKIAQALASARRGLGLDRDEWSRVLLAAGGVALLVAGPVGPVLAAPAGLAGAVAVTSALAAFGPGGMVSGMALTETIGTGAVTATSALVSSSDPAVVERRPKCSDACLTHSREGCSDCRTTRLTG